MAFITTYTNVWNSALWLPWVLRGIYDFADCMVVGEVCWVKGDWEADTSSDGTPDIIRQFMQDEDTEGKVRFHQGGNVVQEYPNIPDSAMLSPLAKSKALHLVPPETTHLVMVDSDEFYFPEDLFKLRRILENDNTTGLFTIPARCFYFDFTYCKMESFFRVWKWFPGQHFAVSASMINSTGITRELQPEEILMYHYSYVSPKWTRLKGCSGVDVTAEHYKRWRENIFDSFNGENLEELYAKNSGGIHVFGGGKLERYFGTHPPVLDRHPLRHKTWQDMLNDSSNINN
jgi:hypothetical protein